MSKAELREYVISHQDDQEAFHTFVDRLTATPSSKIYPASMSVEEIKQAILDHEQRRE